MTQLIQQANELLKAGGFDYAFCGGYAIEIYLDKTIRNHGDIDISAFWQDRDKIIRYMQSLGWQIFELCGGGIARRIYLTTDMNGSKPINNKRNIFCATHDCDVVSLTPTNEPDLYEMTVNHREQHDLTYIEFLFNEVAAKAEAATEATTEATSIFASSAASRTASNAKVEIKNAENRRFLFARNREISLPMSRAVLHRDGIPYLAPEMVLLYKSTDTEREGYQLDYDAAIGAMSEEQITWFHDALAVMNPNGHKWLRPWYHGSPLELVELATGSTITRWRALAEAFSHKPARLCYDKVGGTIHHNGQHKGFLYVVDEPILEGADVYKHPRTTMDDGVEWLTKRPLRLRKINVSMV